MLNNSSKRSHLTMSPTREFVGPFIITLSQVKSCYSAIEESKVIRRTLHLGKIMLSRVVQDLQHNYVRRWRLHEPFLLV